MRRARRNMAAGWTRDIPTACMWISSYCRLTQTSIPAGVILGTLKKNCIAAETTHA